MQAYDQQPVYDISYFRPSIDDAVRGSGLPSPQEVILFTVDLLNQHGFSFPFSDELDLPSQLNLCYFESLSKFFCFLFLKVSSRVVGQWGWGYW